jgi:trehalose-phosphatase
LRPVFAQIKVQGLFLDYDGTIGPVNVSREESKVSQETATILHQIKQLIPVGIITTKDLSFILPRTPFASAWSAIAGLEIKIGSDVVQDTIAEATITRVLLALDNAQELGGDRLFIEKKSNSKGQVLAFCVDWRHCPEPKMAKEIADKIITSCTSLGLVVIEYRGQAFFDVYPCRIDKGKALTQLKRKLGIKSGVVYLGDSKVDNPAFHVADVGIGVLHQESVTELNCDYHVKFEDVAQFLRHLLDENLVFHKDFPEISLSRIGREVKNAKVHRHHNVPDEQ